MLTDVLTARLEPATALGRAADQISAITGLPA
jgi:hypothetical protein